MITPCNALFGDFRPICVQNGCDAATQMAANLKSPCIKAVHCAATLFATKTLFGKTSVARAGRIVPSKHKKMLAKHAGA